MIALLRDEFVLCLRLRRLYYQLRPRWVMGYVQQGVSLQLNLGSYCITVCTTKAAAAST